MKIVISIILFICAFILKIGAQVNYVLNPSLEKYSQCPVHFDQIRFAYYWGQLDTNIVYPLCSPEYCNSCASLASNVSIPVGAGYNHYARTGNGMVNMQMYFDSGYSPQPYQRDYLQGRLYTKLTAGKSYCVTFYAVMGKASKYAINNIGAYLDNGSIDTGLDSTSCASPQTTYTPQILETAIISDTLNWVKVQGNFSSNGSEKFITIGNFFDKPHTLAISIPYINDHFSWYLIDDVSVIESTEVANAGPDITVPHGDSIHIGTYDEGMPCNWYVLGSTTVLTHNGGLWVKPDITTSYVVELDLCGNVTRDTVKVTVDHTNVNAVMRQFGNVVVYPNPASNNFTIEHAEGGELVICDVVGHRLDKLTVTNGKEVVDISHLPKGVYVVQVVDAATGYRVARRIVKE